MRKHVYGHILVVPLVNKSVLMNLFQRCCAWHESSTFTQPHWQSESCNGSISYIFSWRPYSHPAKVKAVVLLSETMNDHTSQLNSIMRGESQWKQCFSWRPCSCPVQNETFSHSQTMNHIFATALTPYWVERHNQIWR